MVILVIIVVATSIIMGKKNRKSKTADVVRLVFLQALKILKTPEFMPYVVFIAAPSLDIMRENYKRATSEGTITRKQTASIDN